MEERPPYTNRIAHFYADLDDLFREPLEIELPGGGLLPTAHCQMSQFFPPLTQFRSGPDPGRCHILRHRRPSVFPLRKTKTAR